MPATVRSRATAFVCPAVLMLALAGSAVAGSLDIPVRGTGLSFGNSRMFDGLRINLRDRDLQSIRGVTISLWAPAPKATGRIQGLSLGLVGTGSGSIDGITLNLVGAGADRVRGLAVGGIGVVGGMRLMQGLLYEVGTSDPVAIGGAVIVLGLVGAVACLLPAVRAARVDPAVTLRGE